MQDATEHLAEFIASVVRQSLDAALSAQDSTTALVVRTEKAAELLDVLEAL